jgi:hypothetical protein
MKKYYLHDAGNQIGPFDVEELRVRNVTRTTPVWYEGLTDWKHAEEIQELAVLFAVAAPPPFTGVKPNVQAPPPPQQQQQATQPVQQQHLQHPPHQQSNAPFHHQPPKKKSRTGLIITLVVLLLIIGIGAVVVVNNPNAIPGMKLEINTPKPTVVTSRADGSKSGLINARTTVYATVMNQGGDGNVLVTFYVYQGNETYDRTQNIYMRAGDSEDLEETFEEVDYVSGEITYTVTADAK